MRLWSGVLRIPVHAVDASLDMRSSKPELGFPKIYFNGASDL
jgi:hypothetical protein